MLFSAAIGLPEIRSVASGQIAGLGRESTWLVHGRPVGVLGQNLLESNRLRDFLPETLGQSFRVSIKKGTEIPVELASCPDFVHSEATRVFEEFLFYMGCVSDCSWNVRRRGSQVFKDGSQVSRRYKFKIENDQFRLIGKFSGGGSGKADFEFFFMRQRFDP